MGSCERIGNAEDYSEDEETLATSPPRAHVAGLPHFPGLGHVFDPGAAPAGVRSGLTLDAPQAKLVPRAHGNTPAEHDLHHLLAVDRPALLILQGGPSLFALGVHDL